MADNNTKYPLHSMKRDKARGAPCYSGSGALHDRVKPLKDSTDGNIPGRGSEKMYMHDGNESHFRNPDHKIRHAKEGRIGSWDHEPMKLGKVHGYRAHASHEGAKELTKHSNETVLRFSGNDAAHRIGSKGGRFGNANFHTQGLPNVNGGNDQGVAGMDPIGKAHAKVQRGNKAQPQGHKSAKKPEASKKGKTAKVGKMRITMS